MKKIQKRVKKKESGRSMIEMVGVLAVMGLLTAGAFILIQSGMASQKRSRAADEIATIVAEMRSVDIKTLPQNRQIEKGTEIVTDLQLPSKTPFGEKTQYGVAQGDEGCFVVGIVKLKDADCRALAKRAWSGDPTSVACKDTTLLIEYCNQTNK